MNRKQRRANQAELHRHNKTFPDILRPLPREQWGAFADRLFVNENPPKAIWLSKLWLVQCYDEALMYPGVYRLSVCRAKLILNKDGHTYPDRIAWDELMQIKREIGLGNAYAIEVYPRDRDIVNVANMRHLWLMPQPLRIGWFNAPLTPVDAQEGGSTVKQVLDADPPPEIASTPLAAPETSIE